MGADFDVSIRWDEAAGVWCVRESSVPGLAAEAETVESLFRKLAVLVPELAEMNGDNAIGCRAS